MSFDLDSSCNFSKLQHNSLTFVAGLKRATDEGSLPEIAQYSPYLIPSIAAHSAFRYSC